MRVNARLGAYAASLTLLAGGTFALATPAQALPSNNPVGVDTGAAWLTAQLTNGLVHNAQYDFDDYGLTVDIALALDSLQDSTYTPTVDAAIAAMQTGAASNYYGSTSGSVTTLYAGSLAKLAALLQRTGHSATLYGGQDLVAKLEGTVGTGVIAGRIQDQDNSFGDANVIGQAFAAEALATASSAKATDARDFLLKQQCPDGGFRLKFTTDKTATGQSCTDDAEVDTDATSIAVSELATLPANGAVTTAIAHARTWLASVRQSDGSWHGTGPTDTSNANSTGLAAVALSGAGSTYASQVADAATWLRGHQVTYYDVCDNLIRQRGAVAYDTAALDSGRTNGITSATQDQFRRATAQALVALAALPQDTSPSDPEMTVPSGYQKARSHVTLTITGVHAGDQLCLNSGSTLLRQFTASGSPMTRIATMPSRSGHYAYAVRDEYGHSSLVRIGVLAPKTLTVVRTPGTVKRHATITAAIHGLAPHEPAKIYYGYRVVRSGPASASGNFVARFDSGTAIGAHYIRGYGQYGDIRKGHTTVTVRR